MQCAAQNAKGDQYMPPLMAILVHSCRVYSTVTSTMKVLSSGVVRKVVIFGMFPPHPSILSWTLNKIL